MKGDTRALGQPQRVSRRWHASVAGVALLLTGAAYTSALGGKFVYDDNMEIVRNPYIQQNSKFWTAITSDVWAFKGERAEPWSNYWRPMFVSWMALNYRLFGLNPLGWHITNIMAHMAVVLLLYHVLCALPLAPALCAATTWLFAVHPTNVESVAWPSGIPNMLHAGFLLASFGTYLKLRQRGGAGEPEPSARIPARWRLGLGLRYGLGWAATVLLYFLALLSKEGAIVLPALVVGTEWALGEGGACSPARWRRGRWWATTLLRVTPFALTAVAFLLLRLSILQKFRTTAPGAPDTFGVLLTAPSVLLFYVRQVLWPVNLSPMYEQPAAVSGDNIGFNNFVLPVLILLAIWGGGHWLLRGGTAWRCGAMWFLLTIGPVLDVRAFVPGQIVHDRYLYLPLSGGLLVLCGAFAAIGERIRRRAAVPSTPAATGGRPLRLRGAAAQLRPTRAGLALAGGGALVLAALTWHYNPVWGGDIPLWERSTRVSPNSPYGHHELGEAYRQAGRFKEARRALERALAIFPDLTYGNIALAALDIQEGRYAEARTRLRAVLDSFPWIVIAVDKLGLCYQQEGRFDEAITTFDDGRKRIPYRRAIYTQNIAVLHKLANRPQQALRELESIRDELNRTADADLLKAWLLLGDLYRDAGDAARSREAYQQFLQRTAGASDAALVRMRREAAEAVQKLAAP